MNTLQYLIKGKSLALPLLALACFQLNCSNKMINQSSTSTAIPVSYYVTKGDHSVLFERHTDLNTYGAPGLPAETINVDNAIKYQTIDGFGYALTGGSATLINAINPAEKQKLLNELFGSAANSIGVSYLRISIGASDLDSHVFSYDDLPAGQTDVNLSRFNLSEDNVALIPVLKQILAINPTIKILGSPWSPPVWMKDNNNTMGGGLLPQYYEVYAQYFVKYIQQMKANGITIDAITIQNEPQHGGNNPSMVMSALQEAAFVKNNLGPAFRKAGLTTKIIVWDHNCDKPEYPITILNDPGAKQYVNGSAFHLYNGDISALTTVHNAHPDKDLYFTEQWNGSKESFEENLFWHTKNVIIGSMRNWSKNALEWNLANDPSYGPHTPGGCSECKGALTISGSSFTRNPSYYIIAHASKFVRPGSVRIASTLSTTLPNVAFQTPDGKKVLIVLNAADNIQTLNIRSGQRTIATIVPSGAVVTYVW